VYRPDGRIASIDDAAVHYVANTARPSITLGHHALPMTLLGRTDTSRTKLSADGTTFFVQ
jgi:hypothetical protein